jgi:hypothetical protein
MTVGKISAACWALFVVMCLGFLPLALGISEISALPGGVRAGLIIVVVGGLWWGPFAYAMYIGQSVIRNGDQRLLKRGIAGTAEVLSAKSTHEVIQSGEFAWEAPRVRKYSLRVTIPGRPPYETDCRICAGGFRQGATVKVAVSPHNRKRVTIDVSQGSQGGVSASGVPVPDISGMARETFSGGSFHAGSPVAAGPGFHPGASSPEAQRLSELAQLSRLHQDGTLTNDEFAAQKARILAE